MKSVIIFSLSFLIALTSCNQTDDNVEPPTAVINGWNLEELYINGQLQDANQTPATYLSISEDNQYYRNYITGNWSFSSNAKNIIFSPEQILELAEKQYQIIEVTDNILIIECNMTEEEYFWDFPEIDDGEIITIREKFVAN
ncbi:MAG: hypothetical protein CMO01_16190 [Thalassobius sp.]|nr:hypothetical protein [Thalassovita sp.]|tara:strand:- start:23 stop:448 length:426 start_codon:yes stop_codon:yes gene_type:complete